MIVIYHTYHIHILDFGWLKKVLYKKIAKNTLPNVSLLNWFYNAFLLFQEKMINTLNDVKFEIC